MFTKLIELISSHNKIILLRHISPDFDAIGSQMSIFQFINDNFKNKTIKLGTTLPEEYKCIGKVDNLVEQDFEKALVIITDTANTARIDIEDVNWLKKATVFKIDHHVNVDKYADYEIVDASYPATCELLTDLFSKSNLIFSDKTAFYLFHGLVTDTDRFMFRNVTNRTFKMAEILSKKIEDLNSIYKNIYQINTNEIRLKGYILSNFKIVKNEIAYIYLNKEVLKEYEINNPDKVALWVNMLGEIKNIKLWLFFVENDSHIRTEFRSQSINVRLIAEKFNGGGHVSASGAKLFDSKSIDLVIEECIKASI
ncbi:DHH family phosphoesterase [Spiroplasma tabanidicola]|uniref:Bifunctional oligoribonuclease and PAP phosphatase NrnA n=1 Tax=Spiroplasma tabanidicola TaxID=324079 RepID=A0A6I6CHY4_9MOLU|nr:bifunctional oligoribonuclease/PAP phosphatase NrnA [Spiroplasma tabanidicola]QGS51663.1 bifunctional oligoribonuclease and PAP phosphatase NrnA [Spiroplasma tabanidicola]